jgi:hypothetical protein
MMLQDACAEGVQRRIQAATRMQSPVLLQHPQLHETMENGPPLDVPDLGCEILESECLFSSEMQRKGVKTEFFETVHGTDSEL